jgi:hypothetical protein
MLGRLEFEETLPRRLFNVKDLGGDGKSYSGCAI